MNLRKKTQTIRILHVVGGMNRGGLETWLMHILRHIDRDRFKIDFLVHTTEPCAYDDEIRALGSKIIPCLDPSKPWLYAHNFQQILKQHGSYDIVHSHVHHFSGYVLRLAEKAGVPLRVAHSHIDSSPLEANAAWYRRLYLNLMKGLIAKYATLGFGCSNVASTDLFGKQWHKDSRWQIFYCGVDMDKFREPVDSPSIRTELGIPENGFVIGHIGRFQKQKNHQFILEIFAEVIKREPRAYLLLVGEGCLRDDIEQQALQMGLKDSILFPGIRSDIPQIMLGVMDAFLFPSLSEGLPMVGIEVQTAGLPLVISDGITEEFQKIKPLVQRISLSQSTQVWADAVLKTRNLEFQPSREECLNMMTNSEFNITSSVMKLTDSYDKNLF
ncbi:MAG: glycosyltransferase family 1 protein [Cyanobacteria bacterium P01_A01_bin.84]